MIRLAVYRVRPDKLDRLKAWLTEVAQRPDEVRESFAEDGITHEQAHLIVTADGPMLVTAVEHADREAVSGSSQHPALPLNVEHEAVMAEVLDGVVETTVLLAMGRSGKWD